MPAINKNEETVIEISKQIFNGNDIHFEGTKCIHLRLSYPDKPFTTLNIEVEREGKRKIYVLSPGDIFNLEHSFKAVQTIDIKNKHVFPIKISFNGQEYFLNKTKQNKLILTK